MSKKSRETAGNTFYSIDDLSLTDDQKEMVLEYVAQLFWQLLLDSSIADGHCKTYDPLIIDEEMLFRSYVFDAYDGGRVRQFTSYKDGEDWLMTSFVEWLNRGNYCWKGEE